MKNMIEKAEVLVEALPHIQRFRGETIVVKFGGSSMDDPEQVRSILGDIAFMSCAGLRPVIVHGGGKAINAQLKLRNIQATFLKGLRVTDDATIAVVEHVLNKAVNPELVRILNEMACSARGIHGEDIIHCVKHVDASDPSQDWGWVGDVTSVDILPIRAFLAANITPVVTPLGSDAVGNVFNINADVAAAGIAAELKARKLVFLSDVPGLLTNPDDKSTLMSTLRLSEVESLIQRGIIRGGMLPKISGALNALRSGVRKTHIIDASMPHSLLLELFTDQGVGTEILSNE